MITRALSLPITRGGTAYVRLRADVVDSIHAYRGRAEKFNEPKQVVLAGEMFT
jgi:hypothetical protein